MKVSSYIEEQYKDAWHYKIKINGVLHSFGYDTRQNIEDVLERLKLNIQYLFQNNYGK